MVRRPDNRVGPMLTLFGTSFNTNIVVTTFGHDAVGRGDLVTAGWLGLVSEALYHPTTVLLVMLLFYYPDGWPRGRWARWFLRSTLVYAVAGVVLGLLRAPELLGETDVSLPHPFLDRATAVSIRGSTGWFELLLVLLGLVALVGLFVKWRRGDGVQRRQIGWLGIGAFAYTMVATVSLVQQEAGNLSTDAFLAIEAAGVIVLPVAIGVAIMRYRLYEIDVIVSKSATYLGIAVVIGSVYAAVVAGPLLLLGRSDEGEPGLLLPLVATGLVAILFDPVRSRLQRWADRLVYGERATPHDVLSGIASRLSLASDDGPNELAALLAVGTGARGVTVWLLEDDRLRAEGVYPSGWVAEDTTINDLVEDEQSTFSLVRHRDTDFGAVQLTKGGNDPITPADRKLTTDVAAGAGLMLRNISLERRLTDRALDLRESRRRLIETQDAARHRLERDLHDGAQQHVVALKVKLGLTGAIAAKEGLDSIAADVGALSEETQHAVDALRSVAHGIYPPLLETGGLEASLPALARTASIPVDITVAVDPRPERTVEETVYFCIREMLALSAASGAKRVVVIVTSPDDKLSWEVTSQGLTSPIDITAVRDRMDAREGSVQVDEIGSSVVGEMPLKISLRTSA